MQGKGGEGIRKGRGGGGGREGRGGGKVVREGGGTYCSFADAICNIKEIS